MRSGFGKLPRTLVDVTSNFSNTNLADTAVCIVSATTLVVMDRALNPNIKAKVGVSLPSNLILVILGCFVSYVLNLQGTLKIAVVGPITGEFPTPSLPLMDLSVFSGVLHESVLQAVIVFTMSISMAMLMEKIHGYNLDANQELIAYGMCNLFSSFYTVQASSVSPPRTMVLSNSGARTTMNGLPTVLVLLGSVTFISNMFEPLPLATLAAMIIVAVIDILKQVKKKNTE